MTADEQEELHQFLATNWYDRDEDDEEIVDEIVSEESPASIAGTIAFLRDLLDRPEEREALSAVVRRSAWRFFAEGVEPPLAWLEGIVERLERAHHERLAR